MKHWKLFESQCDLIMTTGGVSVGEEDHVKPAVEKLGELNLWKIRMKPGKPLAFGKVKQSTIYWTSRQSSIKLCNFLYFLITFYKKNARK